MTIHELGELAGDVLLLCAALLVNLCAVQYARIVKWRALRIGRSLFYMLASLGVVLSNNALSVWLSADYPLRWATRPLIYGGLTVAAGSMLVTLRWLWRARFAPDTAEAELLRNLAGIVRREPGERAGTID